MDWNPATLWWVAAGVLVAAELASGTFYLLMVAIGLVAGALAAHLGAGLAAQISAAALVGAATTVAWHLRRPARRAPPISENQDVNLDVGEAVHVAAWGADGTARVAYRGSTWTARLAPGLEARPGPHRVRAVEGNWLVLAPAP
ncbi:NfeD family protein [Piscinibacter sakaiensis]|uniref:Putative activity regulator of membrane protease YbbK n=1 Tax=Piscinibacter sakaiensis TaxID=1547922 RepID=A0A0K8P3C6_PISS1|nr:NfeD family protein [Piscinibacter sakaiensis]GAP37054.1 putative activity regulator of membrane protease YbbK [Piscinibacter sakaiensis]